MWFDDTLRGEGCDRNWMGGVMGWPEFSKAAPALLGFDETIFAYCSSATGQNEGPFNGDNAGLGFRCLQANQNVLRLFNWNMCVLLV